MPMPQRRRGARALGPYRHGNGWRVIEVGADGGRTPGPTLATKAEALAYQALYAKQVVTRDETTADAWERYERYLKAKGNSRGSIERTQWSIEVFFPVPMPLWSLRPRLVKQRYMELTERYAVDSHRNALAELRTFCRWLVAEGILPKDPSEGVQGIGRRKRRKPQLRIKDARAWYQTALPQAEAGDERAVAALMALLLGMRASEICQMTAGHLDEDDEPFDTLHVTEDISKTDPRTLTVPTILRPMLARLAEGKDDASWLFPGQDNGHRQRDWVRQAVHRICDVAGVERVTAHSMRGQLATITMRAGAIGEIVSQVLGHRDHHTTKTAYAAPGASGTGERLAGLEIIDGRTGDRRAVNRSRTVPGNDSTGAKARKQ